jgi:AraC-like DNA-binding protein
MSLASDPARYALIRVYVATHLEDPDLNYVRLAAVVHISRRTLYRLCWTCGGTTPSALIRDARLEACRRDLADPLWAGVPVRKLAARWLPLGGRGFEKAFRRRYGTSPQRYRASVLAGDRP